MKQRYSENTSRDRFYRAIRNTKDILPLLNPQLCRDLIKCLITMQGEYHDTCASRDFHEKEFNRLMSAVMREKLEDAAQQWISVKDRNPAVKTMVLVCHKNFGIQMGYLDENSVKPCRNHWIVYVREHEEWTGNNIPKTGKYEYVNISHWMELPAAPKDEV